MNSSDSISLKNSRIAVWCLSILLVLLTVSVYGQQPIQVNVTVMQPVTPYLPQLAADVRGGQYGHVEESLSNKLIVRVTNTSNVPQRIKLSARIERLSPTPASVSLRPDYQPAQPLILAPQQTIQLDRQLIEETFGNFSRGKLVFENLSLSALRQNEVNYKLPEGIYRLCIQAYDYDRAGQSAPLSTMGASCAVFNICYTASAPQFTMPVSTLMGGQPGFTDFTPNSPQIQFVWTPPATTCGLPLGRVTYDLEIREMYAGQALNDAKNNPFVFRQQAIPTNMFLLDTLKYPHVFEAGNRYTVRVKANIQKMANSPLEIANQGYSELAAITYQPKSPITGVTSPSVAGRPSIGGGRLNLPDDVALVATSGTITTGNDCEGVEPPTNTTLTQEELLNKDIQVGAFTMHVKEVTRNGDNYTGTGQITWEPFAGRTLLLAVTFADIQINTDFQLVSGVVNSARNSAIPEWANLSGPEDIPYLSTQLDGALSDLNEKINTAVNPIRQAMGESAVTFPLGLNEVKLAGSTSTLAIMSISFTATGTDMRMLFNMNIPEASNWLSLAGTGFCIQPDGFSGEKGILYLPSDRDVNLDGTVFTLKGAMATDGSLDTTKTTYLKWNADGFERLFVKADLTLPEDLKAVDGLGKRTGEGVKMQATFDFNEWDNWIANLTTSGDFEMDNLSGFVISMNEGLYYDHSAVRNPQPKDGMVWPIDQDDQKFIGKDAGYQGIYMKKLTMKLPADFVGIGGDAPDITFTDLFINGENGLWADINAQNLLDINEGKIGGWAFSIDQLTLPIKKWVPQGASMDGKIGLPISTESLNYTCNLNTAKQGLSYQFKIEPQNQYKIPMWAAELKLDSATNITINKEAGKDVQVGAELHGVLGITVFDSPKIVFNAVDIQGMQIANYNMFLAASGLDPKTGEMYFNSGNIKFGSLEKVPGQSTNAYIDPAFFDQDRMLAKGPAAPTEYALFPVPEDEEVAGSSVAGFGISAKGFRPLVDITGEGLKVGFSFDLGLSLGFDAIKVANTTTLSIYGVIGGTSSNPIPVETVGVGLEKITLDGDFGPVTVSGSLAFREGDATWGDGILADSIRVGFPPGIDVEVSVMFGNVDGYQYFGLGGKVYSATGFGAIGPVVINGFGGGLYYNMALTKPKKGQPVEGSVVSFKPSGNGYGLTANLDLSYVNATVLKASVEMALSHDDMGGFAFALEGTGDIISDGKKGSQGIAHGDVKMKYANECFDGYFGISADILAAHVDIPIWIHAGYTKEAPPREDISDEALKAIRENKGNFDFWLYLGRPDEGTDEIFNEKYSRIQAYLFGDKNGPEKGPFYTLQMSADAYFCIGSQLPAFPELPLAVRSFMEDGDLSAKKKAAEGSIMDAVKGGGGFMFGAGVHGRAELQLAIFYANAQVDVGFDVALKHYTGSPCGSSTYGMNGWYARGQFYAYLAMDVGFQIDVWFWEGRVSLANLAIGATLEAGLPNPTWMDGRIRIKGSVLGGMVRVNTGCQFSIGERCADGDPLATIQMINEMGPAEEDVSVYANPYVAFSVPISDGEGKTRELSFEVEEADEDGMAITDENGETKVITRVYKFFVWDYHLAQYKNQDKKIDGTELTNVQKRISDDGFTMSLLHDDAIMKDHKQYGIYIKCMAQEKVGGVWRTPKEYARLKDGFTQDSVVLFTSGAAPDSIAEYNVVNGYPLNGQNFLLKNEFAKKGRIKLFGGYNAKFFGLEGATPVRKLTFVSKDGTQKIETTFNPVLASNTIEFTIPEDLKNSTVYQAYFTVEDKNYVPSVDQKQEITTRDKDLRKTGRVHVDMKGYKDNITKNVDINRTMPMPRESPSASGAFSGKGALTQAIATQRLDFSKEQVMQQIGAAIGEQDSLMLLGRKTEVFQPESGRTIYTMTFGTSRYNSFKEKFDAYGDKLYGTATNKQSRIHLQATNDPRTEPFSYTDKTIVSYDLEIPVFEAGEGFDEWELIGMKRQVGGDPSGLSTYILPPLLRVSTTFAQDKYGSDAVYRRTNLYDPVVNLVGANNAANRYLTIDFGDPLTVRGSYLKYSGPGKATSIDNVGYYKLLNAKGERKYVSTTSYIIPGVQLNIVDETNQYLARDFALMKLADYWYNAKRKDMNIYYDALSGDARKVMELYYALIGKEGTPFTEDNKNLSDEGFRNASFLTYLTTFGTLAAGENNSSVKVNIDNDKASYWDKWYYATGFWMGAPAYKQMEIIRKAAFKPVDYTNNSQSKYVNFVYGYPTSYDYSLDQYNTVQDGFDYKKYPLFPANISLQKPLAFISGAAMATKKEQARKDFFAGPKNATGITAQPIGKIPGITPPVNVRQGINTEGISIKGRTWPPVIFIQD